MNVIFHAHNWPMMLKEARLAAGLSQRALAQMIGMSFNSVRAYEHGRRRPSTRTLIRLMHVLDHPEWMQRKYFP